MLFTNQEFSRCVSKFKNPCEAVPVVSIRTNKR